MPRERRPTDVQKVFNHINAARREVIKAVERAMEVDAQIGLRPGHRAELLRRLEAARDEADKLVRMLEGEVNDLVMVEVKDLRRGDRTPWYEILNDPEQRADLHYRYAVLVRHCDTGVTDYVTGYGDEKVPVHRSKEQS